jgi:predicted Zn-dependent protease
MKNTTPVNSAARPLHRALLALLLAILGAPANAQDQRIELPDMGNSAENYLSDGEEAEYARAIIMQMRAYGVLVDDPQVAEYFADMGFRLVAHSDEPTKPFQFLVLDEDRVNAFAAPGGVIALHSGLILAAETPHEVAGVLAHEVAHITQLHLYRTLQRTQSMTVPIALGTLALILAGGGGGEVITGALMTGQAMQQQAYINFTRENEEEADRIGIVTLSQAGFDPRGMADFFERMGRINRVGGEGPPAFLRTHPVTVNRIAEAKDRAANMPIPEPGDELDFYLMQARLRALTEDQPGDARDWFLDRLDEPYSEPRTRAHQYGLAIALQRLRGLDGARQRLERLLERDPDKLAYQLQMADLDLAAERESAALERLDSLYRSFPGNHAIAVQYSEALLRGRDPQQAALAEEILAAQLLSRKDDPRLYELQARAASIAGDEAGAEQALAEAYFHRGSGPEALEQLELVLARDDLDYYRRARAAARLEEMRVILSDFEG